MSRMPESVVRGGERMALTRFDVLMLVNALVLGAATLWAVFVTNEEFGLYAVIVLALYPVIWKRLRDVPFPVWVLVMLEAGLLMHFAGGFVVFGGHSLYGHHIFGVGVDKYVHLYNGAMGAVALGTLYRLRNVRLGVSEVFLVVFAVAGLGSLVEIAEFLVAMNVPQNGVGDHANTVGDLIANVSGAYAGYLLWSHLANKGAFGPALRAVTSRHRAGVL